MNAHFKFFPIQYECRAARTEDEVYFMANRQQSREIEKEREKERGRVGKDRVLLAGGSRSTRVCNQIISPKNREIITSEFFQIHFQFSTKSAKAFSPTNKQQQITFGEHLEKLLALHAKWLHRRMCGFSGILAARPFCLFL